MSLCRPLFIFLMFVLCQPVSADLVAKTTTQVVEAPDVTMSLLKVTGGLLLVIIAIFGSAWAYRRFGNIPTMSNDDLRVIGGISLSAKERVILMQVGDEQILLGVSPGSIQRLHVLEKNIDVNKENVEQGNSFSTQLNSAIKQWKSK